MKRVFGFWRSETQEEDMFCSAAELTESEYVEVRTIVQVPVSHVLFTMYMEKSQFALRTSQ